MDGVLLCACVSQFNELVGAFDWCGKSSAVHVAVLTGSPLSQPDEFYSSGNDLGNFTLDMDLSTLTKTAREIVERLVNAFIHFPKPLIAAVNGPAYGIAVTTLLLCDLVFTNEKATFTTPFTKLAQNPEGCSSLLFPQRLGQRANRMLLLGETLTAQESVPAGCVLRAR
jgi:peroxisomal 3,2-trans-enoyl-CoA isomerase